jgi:hypothetical protein
MVRRAGPDLTILAGSGLRAENVGALVAATGVRAVHASCSVMRDGGNPRAWRWALPRRVRARPTAPLSSGCAVCSTIWRKPESGA